MDSVLEKLGLKYEDLSDDERETLNEWNIDLEKKRLTLDRVRSYIGDMKASVENELSKSDLNHKQDLFLKARLRNYMLLEGFLDSPKKAKERMELQLSGIKKSKT